MISFSQIQPKEIPYLHFMPYDDIIGVFAVGMAFSHRFHETIGQLIRRETMPWNQTFECMPIEKLRSFQLDKLRETIKWVSKNVPFYRRKLHKCGISYKDIAKIEDITALPLTTKSDLRDCYPFGMCAVPLTQVVQVHASSGTTGKPITGPYTGEDYAQWVECVARNVWAAGIRSDDTVQNAYGYGLFTGGLGFHQALNKIGCTVVPASSGMTERQVHILRDFKVTALFCTPSYALNIAEKAEDLGVALYELPLRIGVFGAEPWTEKMRDEIEGRMGIKAMEAYGLTELCGPGVAFDCHVQDGLHINEDHFLPEILDPETLKPLPLGETGELVFTSLQRRAMPLLRYRTRDITSLYLEQCECGRTLVKMKKVGCRSDDMLIINGLNVFPSQIEVLLLDIDEVLPQYRLVVRKNGHLDKLIVQAEAQKEIYLAGDDTKASVERAIEHHIKSMIGLSVTAQLMSPKTIERSIGKAKRIVDERNLATEAG